MAVPVIMPKLEMSQETARIVEWLKHEGDIVRQGEPLVIVQTDKVEVEVEAPASGILTAITAAPGQDIPVTTVIAQLAQPDQTASQHLPAQGPQRVTPIARRIAEANGLDLRQITGTGPAGRISRADVEAALQDASPAAGLSVQRARATPAARRVAREMGLDLRAIPGTGPRGRVQEVDVRVAGRTSPSMSHVGMRPDIHGPESPGLPAASSVQRESGATPGMDISPEEKAGLQTLHPLTGLRGVIAERMTASYRTAPHIHLSVTADVTQADAARKRWEAFCGEKVSLTVLLVKACAWALRRHPAVNATVDEEGIHRWAEVNVGVAVALPDGLIVPVLRRADTQPIGQLASALNELVQRARQGRLRPEEVSGGTFTLTNLGTFGIETFDPILNPPQAAILGVGAVVEAPVARDGAVVIRPRITLTLAADHRALDGADAARFLQDIRRAIEDPALMLL